MPAVFYQFVSYLQVECFHLNFTFNQILISDMHRSSINCPVYANFIDWNYMFVSTVLDLSDG